MAEPIPSAVSTRQHDEAAQRQQLTRLRNVVAMGTRALRTGNDWEAWLHRAEPLMPIAFANTMLIWGHRPTATMLLSYDAWQQVGRQVNPGERGIRIIVTPETESSPGGSRPRPGVVFDLAQTHGASIPVRPLSSQYAGQLMPRAWDALANLAFREGFRVERGDCAEGDAYITWRDRRIHVRRDADDLTAITALSHQLGHVLLHADAPYLDGTRFLEIPWRPQGRSRLRRRPDRRPARPRHPVNHLPAGIQLGRN